MIKTMEESARDLIKAVNVNANKDVLGDQPPNFAGRPERGGKAMDAAFNKRFPGAARIGHASTYGEQPAQQRNSQQRTTASINVSPMRPHWERVTISDQQEEVKMPAAVKQLRPTSKHHRRDHPSAKRCVRR